MGLRIEVVGPTDLGLQRLDSRTHELSDPAALPADQMIVSLTEVNVLVDVALPGQQLLANQTTLDQQFEIPIDRGARGLRTSPAHRSEQLLGVDMAVLGVDLVEQCQPLGRQTQAAVANELDEVFTLALHRGPAEDDRRGATLCQPIRVPVNVSPDIVPADRRSLDPSRSRFSNMPSDDPERVLEGLESSDGPVHEAPPPEAHDDLEWYELGPLPMPMRIGLYLGGWLVVFFGLAELFLPGPGLLFIFLGAAILSLASEATHRSLRRVLKGWPAGHNRMERMRARLHHKLSRDGGDPPTPRRGTPGRPEV